MEAYALKSSPAREFHLGNVVLVAPDLDGDVAVTKIFKVFSDPDLPFGGEAEPGTTIPPSPGLKAHHVRIAGRQGARDVRLAIRKHRKARAHRRDDVHA